MCCDDAIPRLNAAELARLAQERLAALRADGEELHPVCGSPRQKNLARQFWGKAWMRHLALCESGGLCLSPGRTLLRYGCVLDLRISRGCIGALVSAQSLCEVSLRVDPLGAEALEALRATCCGRIESHIALLEGRLDAPLLECLCDPENGLLPTPGDWHMQCSCPDWAEPCPHAAAAIYGAGLLIDADPSLLFTLRSLDPEELLRTEVPDDLPICGGHPLEQDEAARLSALFGIDWDTGL